MRNAVSLNLYEGFRFAGSEVEVSHLQYVDDALWVGTLMVENLWTLKALLQGFEKASGLKVNFVKSCLIGVNVQTEFMEMACNFLHCSQGVFPFKYLGLPVGANHRRCSTWQPLIDLLDRKLNSWGNKYISFGGRIVLINSVLNFIPIFYLSFMKMSVVVWKKIVHLQKEFLWGGVGGGRKISWMKWKSICQKKENGGLGVRDIRVVNVSFLAKWRWRLLVGDNALWKEVLVAKYGDNVSLLLKGTSNTWRDGLHLGGRIL